MGSVAQGRAILWRKEKLSNTCIMYMKCILSNVWKVITQYVTEHRIKKGGRIDYIQQQLCQHTMKYHVCVFG